MGSLGVKSFTSEEIENFVSGLRPPQTSDSDADKDWPTISVVTPSYNQGEFLERTIRSVLNQGYPALEYIIVDGGSTDGSVDVIRKYQSHLACWVSEKDDGQSHAIRKGFNRATGRILAWLNSDDVYLPGTLRRAGRAFMEASSTDVVYGNVCLIDENDSIIGDRRLTPFIPYLSKYGMLYGGFGINQPAAFWTKALYERVGGIDTGFRFTMDNDLFLRLALAGARFRFLREYFTGFRVHPDSKTSTIRHVAQQEKQIIQTRYCRSRSRLLSLACLTLVRAARTVIYITQGDTFYLLKRKLVGEYTWVP